MFIDFPITQGSRRRHGFTLVELLVSMGLGMIAITAVAAITLYSARSFAAMQNYADLDDKSRNALDRLTRDVRQVDHLSAFATNSLTFIDGDGGTLIYSYDPSSKKLVRSKGGTNEVLLTECNSLAFGMFQRNPIGGTFNQFSNTLSAANCKLVQVTWTCSRRILQAQVNTESVQTAKIVIRKQ